jgi:hypothetical protein
MESKVLNIIKSSFEEVNQTRDNKIGLSNVNEISIYGDRGVFDSMGVVNFVTIVEETIYEEFGVEVSLLSEKALSMKVSPFSSVKKMIDFIILELSDLEVAQVSG